MKNKLTDADISHFKERLETMRAELVALIESSSNETDPVQLDQASIGRLTRMDAMQRQAMAQETERRRQNNIRRIDAALKRIENGQYGDCIVSGEPIPRARLDLDPAVATTVPHAR